MQNTKLITWAVFPKITVPKLGGGELDISTPAEGYDWKLVVVYRGKHCPLCTNYLKDLSDALPEINKIGVDVVALSADSESRAQEQISGINPNYEVGYGLTIEQMKILWLYISGVKNGMNVEAPFAEPGLFVINEKGNLHMIDISNVPFMRPEISRVLGGMTFMKNLKGDFPVNGSHAD